MLRVLYQNLLKRNISKSIFVSLAKMHSRGALIVVEGSDRSGKSTQCKMLVSALMANNINVKYINFPDRTTKIGHLINDYLSSKVDLSDETIHLLFSANRWENVSQMRALLQAGTTLIIDRYAYSGVAFSAAKGLDIEWCKSCDKGLPKPDRVYFLTLDSETRSTRPGFGDEKYEVAEFQERVLNIYEKLKEPYWTEINANKSIEDLHRELIENVKDLIKNIGNNKIGCLW